MNNKQISNFALDLDENTKSQFDSCCSEDFVVKAALMPDAHSGYVAPIGSVFVTKDRVVPSWVGYDIGCGMIACKVKGIRDVGEVEGKAKEIFEDLQKRVPMGMGKLNHIKEVSSHTRESFKRLLLDFKGGEYREEVYKFLRNKALSHLGTLGDGNHFIELSRSEDNEELWFVIHSGSRGVGYKVAEFYMKEASGDSKKFEVTSEIDVNSIKGKEYLNILNFGLEFALLNRLEMAYKVRDCLRDVLKNEKIDFELWCNRNHNHAIEENGFYIHRKGATPAKKNERGVIPANMRDGCFLVEGLGNKDFLESSSHGAGRRMSRNETKKRVSMKEFEDSMKGIVGTVREGTLDEAPAAYKNIFDVMEKQKDSVRIVKRLIPIVNWKGERGTKCEK